MYLAMYREMCRSCVERGVLFHYISICADDAEARDILFNLGFGAYGADAFVRFDKELPYEQKYEIAVASLHDARAVFDLRNSADNYFMQSPVYLRLEPCSLERIEEMIRSQKIYVAKDGGAYCRHTGHRNCGG